MGAFTIIRTKINEKILYTVKSIKTPPGRAKAKKWNNYTTKHKTTHHRPNYERISIS